MCFYYIAISSIILVPVLLFLFSGVNLIFEEGKKDFKLKEKWLLFLVVVLLLMGMFGSFYFPSQQNGFVNIISLSGYLLSISIVGKYTKKRCYKVFTQGCYYLGILLLILSFPYLISVIIYPNIKDIAFFKNLEQLDATTFSFAIAAMIIAGEVFSKNKALK